MTAPDAAARATVRPARRGDLARVWELLNGLAEYERWTEYVTGTREELGDALFGAAPAAECIVAESAGAIVGYAIVYPTFSSFRVRRMLWLEDLFVVAEARGTGAGRLLLAAVARRALERGCFRVDWLVLDWNEQAIGFYRRMGATPTAAGATQLGLTRDALERIVAETPA
ncbi:MAG: GNAT family N-acetyltransferase [Candidatus Eisenbacteria bacterium]|uniref:GNAT family N-acetyltransferase n=1 Tax=Eiseniibacteriota bacterium TaxID=2212470 RepID=A0A9D6QII5_UNCEI|nr:GNAT family N-acetyltransferase [Candidatus Eisenbacteria bacterium]MBI3539407.1 GNAT family N-acetyltransferase [Candidatus Eisenbacteria bacterium]